MSIAGGSGVPGANAVPAYVTMKAARAAVELGKREWVSDATTEFPRVVLALIDQNGHSSGSLQRIFGGMVILTILVDDALDTSRADVRAADRAALYKRIGTIADGIVSALEIGLRINGPGLSPTVPAAAARTVGSVVRISPSVAASAVDVLRRRSIGHSCDLVGAECLGVLADLYSEAKIPLPGPWRDVLGHLTSLLNPVAMREIAAGNSESLSIYRKRLTAYADAVLCRCIENESGSAELESALNGFMGCSMRWGAESPESLPDALNSWINILETIEDAEVEPNRLLTMAYGALTKLCCERCMFSTNANVLRALESYDDDDDNDNDEEAGVNCSSIPGHSGSTVKWEDPEFLAEVAVRPAVMVSMLFGNVSYDAAGETGSVSRSMYTSKCIETLVSIARVFPSALAFQVAELAYTVLLAPIPTSEGGIGPGDSPEQSLTMEAMLDKEAASVICHSVAPCLPSDSAAARSLSSAVSNLFAKSPSSNRSTSERGTHMLSKVGAWRPRLDVNLLRSATALGAALASPTWPEGQRLATGFVHASRDLLQAGAAVSRPLSLSASILLLTMGDLFRQSLFAGEPPIPPIHAPGSPHGVVGSLAVVGFMRWSLSAKQGHGEEGAGMNSPVSLTGKRLWEPRMVLLQQCCGVSLSEFASVCTDKSRPLDEKSIKVLFRGAVLARSMLLSLYDEGPDCKDAVWGSIARHLSSKMVEGLHRLCDLVSVGGSPLASKMDHDQRGEVLKCVGALIGAVGCSLRVFRRQVVGEVPGLPGELIAAGLSVAKQEQSPILARSLLTVLREQIGDGFEKDKEHLVAPAIELASQSLDGDPDVAIAAVGVLTESLTRHWLLFFPGDVVRSTVSPSVSVAPASHPSEGMRKLYLLAFSSILTAIRHGDVSVSREGMLSLERIQAQRKLYSRMAAFRDIGGGPATIGACIGAMWSSPLAADEACAVVWGVGHVDWGTFYGIGGTLLGTVRTVGAGSEEQTAKLVEGFGQPVDRPTFTRALVALVNDLRFTSSMNKGPSI